MWPPGYYQHQSKVLVDWLSTLLFMGTSNVEPYTIFPYRYVCIIDKCFILLFGLFVLANL